MKKRIQFIFFTILLLTINSCSSLKGVRYKTVKAPKLLAQLKQNNQKGIMIGHQDDLAYGIDWKYTYNDALQSDVQKATGQFPAVVGWDVGNVGDSLNIDGVPFSHMRKLIQSAHKKGIINTISWHIFLYKDSISSWSKIPNLVNSILPGGKNHTEFLAKLNHLATFIKSLKTKSNKQIPILFRPWHEMDGDWFWWGNPYCTPEEYKSLFRFTINYLKNEKQIKNLLVTYSPDCKFNNEIEYLTFYPGDDYVDILGTDNYYDYTPDGDGLEAIIKKLTIVTTLAEKKGKLAAFTETGSDKLLENFWFTNKLGYVLETNNLMSKLSYVLFWRNRDTDHFYVPYKGHGLYNDFINFSKKKNVLLLKGK